MSELKNIAEIRYTQSGEHLLYQDAISFCRELQHAIDVYGAVSGAFRYQILDRNNWDLRYQVEKMILNEFDEEIAPKEVWIAAHSAKDALTSVPGTNIKVILDDGVVSSVLKDQDHPIHVEVVDCTTDYSDYEKLAAYRDAIYADPTYTNCDYHVANYEEPDPVKVYAVSPGSNGTVKKQIFSGTYDDCTNYLQNIGGVYIDENRFEWNVELVDERNFPNAYFDAVSHFSREAEGDIDSEFSRQHAKELVYCYDHHRTLIDFDFWTAYETLLDESLNYEEYSALDSLFDSDPNEIHSSDRESIEELRTHLIAIRKQQREEAPPSLDTILQDAEIRTPAEQVNGALSPALER